MAKNETDLKVALPQNLFLRDGTYYVRKKHNGIRMRMSTGKQDLKSALRRYHEIMKSWNDGESGWERKENPTLKDYWVKTYRPAWTVGKKTPLPHKPNEYRDDQLMQVPLEDMGGKRLSDVTPSVAQKWANRRRAMRYTRKKGGPEYQLSEGTVTREVGLLQAVFAKAVDDGLIEKNPWKSVEREDYTTRERVLTPDEQAKLQRQLSDSYERWMLFMLGTGLRLEEARGIDPKTDINFAERWVRVTRKTKGRRKRIQNVPLIDTNTLDALQAQLTAEGKLWTQNPQRFREILSQACERAGVDHISPHTLRHTFATRYLQGGGDIYILSQILGHSSVAVTEKVYAHLMGADLLKRSKGINLGLDAPGRKVLPFAPAVTG